MNKVEVTSAADDLEPTEPEVAGPTDVPKDFRRLKWDEVVSSGDFIANAQQGFDLWEGPSGFRASTFLNPIYRKQPTPPAGTKRSR